MALSFNESKRAAENEKRVAEQNAKLKFLETSAVQSSLEYSPLAAVDSNFTKSERYTWIDSYSDDDYSTVDATKNITVSANQVNLTQENNSQVIPFEMPRFWDGIDLMDMTLQVHYTNANGDENRSAPINVSFSDDKIRFYWLVSDSVTVKDGNIKFEITAAGAVNVPNTGIIKNYMWRTKTNTSLNVLKSLSGNKMVDPTGEDWYTEFLSTVTQQVGKAQEYASNAKLAAEEAKASAASVDDKIQNAADSIKTELEVSLGNAYVQKTALETILSAYYTSEQVDKIVNALEGKIDSIDGLSDFKVTYDSGTSTLRFFNGEEELYTFTLSTDPNTEWVSAYSKVVDNKISSAVGPVQESLDNYKKSNDEAIENIRDSVGNLPDTLRTDYYTKKDIDGMAAEKADKTSIETINNEIGVIKNDVKTLQDSVDAVNSDITDLQEKVANIKPDQNAGREYDITYEDSKLSLLENGEVKTQVVIEGGSGGGSSSVITIERLNGSALTVISGNSAAIEFNFKSVDNSGDDTGSAVGTWYVGSTKVATQTILQGKNTFDVTQYLRSGDNTIKLSVTDSVGSIGTKNWSINVIEFRLESSFDDTLIYSGDVTFRFTPYGNIAKTIAFTLDGKKIGEVSSSATGRQMTYTISSQEHGSHLLEVSMSATVNGETVTSNKICKDILWAEEGNTSPMISCAVREYTAKQYSTVAIRYTVYDPSSSSATITTEVDGVKTSTLTVGRTEQVWSFKSGDIGVHTLTITCKDVIKTITVTIEDLGISIEPVKTNLAFDFNPTGKTNADSNRLWNDGNTGMTVSDNFDWSNGGYQIDDDGDTYFCVKAGTTATIDYKLFADDAKKLGKNFKLVFKTTNVKDYDATAVTCLNGNIGLNIQAQKVTLTSEQNSISLPTCEDDFMEFEFNILPDSQYKEMVLWLDGIPCRVELYDGSDNFTQANPVGITIGSADCDVLVYRMKSYMMNLTDDEILDNFIADAKNAELMVERYNRNNITNVSGELEPDLLAEKCPDLRIIKISAPTFTTGKKNEVANTTIQQIYKNGRVVEDNWTATGSHKGQGTSSNAYGEAGRNIDINCSGGFVFGDDSSGAKYALTENSVPEKYFNIKVNIASSENANNALLADDYNEFNPYIRKARKDNPKVRDTMAFYPCVVFIQETDTENATVFNDGQWHFYACGDIGNSKKNNDTMGMNPDNHKEVIIEIDNNTDEQTRFLNGDFSAETWDGDHSFEFRYINSDCTEEEVQAAKNAWVRVQNWVVNADDEEFKAHFEDYFVKDSALYFYLFTERHTMVDNRAKNVFPHTEDLIHWDFCFDYDNDTAQGNDNEGGLTLTYGYEDVDTIGTKSVFNASDSKLWCKIRDLFADDLRSMFLNRESALAWSANRILKKFETYQDAKPEKLWIMDMRRKYFRTYEDNGTTSYLPMMHGNKRHQRRQFQKYQEKYIASKYSGTAATADDMTIRGYTPTNWAGVQPDGTFHIKPYADTYVSVLYGSNPVKMRGKRGQTYEVKCPIAAMNDTEVYVYNASMIQSIGDISGFYPGYVDFSHGTKLTDLQVGSSVDGYANTNLTDFAVGNNTLLEHLNLQNVPNLKKSISLTGCTNLEEFLADGSGITGVAFARGGKIKKAHLPAIASLTARNLEQLTDFTIEDYSNITTLVIENCSTIDLKDLIEKCNALNRVRLVGIDWELEDTSLLDRLLAMTGIDENGYNTDSSVLDGSVHIPVVREKQLADYNKQWPDLKVTYNTLVQQFTWTFVNANGEILDVQYIDKGGKAVDPVTRAENPIAVPTMPSTVSTDFIFKGWDTEFVTVFGNQTVTALYDESVRQYTIRYLNNGSVLQTTLAPYGSMVLYNGDTPVYTAEESAYKYYLFSGWDNGGYVSGDKDINAVYDTCEYSSGYFTGKEIGDLRPVEIYAMTKLGLEKDVLEDKDSVVISMGNDFHYGDIQDNVLISEKTEFTGSNYVDTGVQLFDEDKDFVLAIDYKMANGNNANSVLAQCFEQNGMNGFKIWNNSGVKLTFGIGSVQAYGGDMRDMLVIRHVKGENKLHIYSSHISDNEISCDEIDRGRTTKTNASIVFGCAKADDGAYENYATGTVYWSKVWFADLGDEACKQLAAWTHENLEFEVCGFKNFYLSDGSNKRCSITFLQKDTLEQNRAFGTGSSNSGGWAVSSIRTYLNARLLNALPIGWRQLIKQVKVSSSIGNKSKEISTSDCYFFIPSAIEVNPLMTDEPYIYEGQAISYMTESSSRVKHSPNGNAVMYWLRSPNAGYASYVYAVNANGDLNGFNSPFDMNYVAVMFCI